MNLKHSFYTAKLEHPKNFAGEKGVKGERGPSGDSLEGLAGPPGDIGPKG